jgi:hypothetical protein
MKKFTMSLVVALVVCALSGSMALAAAKEKFKSSIVTFGADFVVGETMVKKGTYKLVFNLKTNELTVVAKDKSVVASTVARVESRKGDISGMEIILAPKGENQALISLAFPGDSRNIVVDARGTQAAMAEK